jgi:predicted XRE-type DNA-binding protein
MKRKLNEDQKLMAYVLNKNEKFRFTMKKIAVLFDVSQPTISNAIRDTSYQTKMKNLKKELESMENRIINDDVVKPLNTYRLELKEPFTIEK